jgi:hypothetical protein
MRLPVDAPPAPAHTGLVAMAQKILPVGEFVDHLKAFEREPITRDRLLNF